jgi:lipoate-protein ligase B
MASKAQTKVWKRLRENIAMADVALREMKSRMESKNSAGVWVRAEAMTALAIQIREDCACLLHGKEMLREDEPKA